MDNNIRELSKKRRRITLLKRCLSLVCVAVLLLTMNGLKQSANTLERIPMCGYAEEHVHSADCYVGDALACDRAEHVHSDACYQQTPNGAASASGQDTDDLDVQPADDSVVEPDLGNLDAELSLDDEAFALVTEDVAPAQVVSNAVEDRPLAFTLGERATVSQMLEALELDIDLGDIIEVGVVENDETDGDLIGIEQVEDDYRVWANRDFDRVQLTLTIPDDILVVTLLDGVAATDAAESSDMDAQPAWDEPEQETPAEEAAPEIDDAAIEVEAPAEVAAPVEQVVPVEVAQPAGDAPAAEEEAPVEEDANEEKQLAEAELPVEEETEQPAEGEADEQPVKEGAAEEQAPVEGREETEEQPVEKDRETEAKEQPEEAEEGEEAATEREQVAEVSEEISPEEQPVKATEETASEEERAAEGDKETASEEEQPAEEDKDAAPKEEQPAEESKETRVEQQPEEGEKAESEEGQSAEEGEEAESEEEQPAEEGEEAATKEEQSVEEGEEAASEEEESSEEAEEGTDAEIPVEGDEDAAAEAQPEGDEDAASEAQPVHTATIDLAAVTGYPLSLNALLAGITPVADVGIVDEASEEIPVEDAGQPAEATAWTIEYDRDLLSIEEAEGDHLVTPVASFESTEIDIYNGSRYALTLVNYALPEAGEAPEQPEGAYPAQTFEGRTEYMKVFVTAPEGAFPEGTAMTLADVEDEKTLTDIEDTVSGDFVEVKRVHAVDITFFDAEGNEIEPLAPIDVVMAVAELEQQQEAVVVHVDDAGEAEVVESRSQAPAGETELTVEMPATDAPAQQVSEETAVDFEADSFSVYAVVVTETIETRYIDAAGETWNITVGYGPDAQIPAGATLAVAEMPAQDYIDQATEALAESRRITEARFFDITILDGDGQPVQPAQPVTVNVALAGEAEGEVSALHFARDGVELLTAERDADATITFDAPGFSVYGIVYTVDFHYEVDGQTLDFSIPGGGFISLERVVEALGIAERDEGAEEDTKEAAKAFVADVADVQFSNPELVDVSKVEQDTTVGEIKERRGLEVQYSADLTEEQMEAINAQTVNAGDWALISVLPFTSEESLTVTMKNGDVWKIRVTDGTAYTIIYQPGTGGYVRVNTTDFTYSTNQGTYSDYNSSKESIYTVYGMPNNGYVFSYWSVESNSGSYVTNWGNSSNSPNEYSIKPTVTGNITLRANFTKTGVRTVTFKANNEKYGNVHYEDLSGNTYNSTNIVLTTDNAGKVPYVVTPIADRGYKFSHWEDASGNKYENFADGYSAISGIQPTVTTNTTFTAVFEEATGEIFVANGSIEYIAGEHGKVKLGSSGNVGSVTGKKDDASGATAIPDSGYSFLGWYDENDNTIYPYSTYKPGDISDNPDKVYAKFVPTSELSDVKINYSVKKYDNNWYGHIRLNGTNENTYSTSETVTAGRTAKGATAYVDQSDSYDNNVFAGWYEISSDSTYKLVCRNENFVPEGYLLKDDATYVATFRLYKSKNEDGGGIVSYNMNLAGVEVKWSGTSDFPWMTGVGGMAFADNKKGEYYKSGDTFKVTDVVPEAEGYVFIGWYDKGRESELTKRGINVDTYKQKNATLRKPGEMLQFLYMGVGQRYTLEALWIKIDTGDKIVPYDEVSHSLVGRASIVAGTILTDKNYAESAKAILTNAGYEFDSTSGQFVTDVKYTLKKYNDDSVSGNEQYSFEETLPGVYTVDVKSAGTLNSRPYTINKDAKLTILPKTITVKKVWDDDSDANQMRPENLLVRLGKDKGDSSLLEPTVSAWEKTGNTWTATYTNLPFRNGDELITYSATEPNAPMGYEQVGSTVIQKEQAYADIFKDATLTNDTFTITNKLTSIIDSENAELKIHKQDKSTSEAMANVSFTLSGGEAELTRKTDAEGNLTLTIPKTDLGVWTSETETKTFTLTETTPENYQAAGPWTVTVKADGTREETSGGITTTYYKWKVESVGELTGKEGVYTIDNEKSVGSLLITKNVTYNNREAATDEEKDKLNGTYRFSVKKNGVEISGSPFTVTVTDGISGSVIVPDLEPGEDYTIEETDAGTLSLKSASGGTDVDSSKVVTVTATAGKTTEEELLDSAKAAFTNNYTAYEITIVKVDTGNTGIRLGGAVFDLYDADSVDPDSKAIISGKAPLQSGITTASSGTQRGTVSLGSLAEGSYYLFETQAPAGYVMMDMPVKITVADGMISLMQGSRNEVGNIEQEKTELMVMNSAGASLPATGGSGTGPVYALGGMLLALALLGFALRRRARDAGE